ncbi:MAG: ABC transporter ATP-binding protein [Planctomycetes bacterium]|nr:ABC transporter ATP-binding protein [Planctomycetota bacterium]
MAEPQTAAPVIRSRGVTKRYRAGLFRRRDALRGVDLEVQRGELLGLAGPNGSGKSTWMRLVAGVEVQSAGELEVLGGSTAETAVRRGIGFLPEDAPFPEELGARACLELLGALSGMKRDEARTRGDALLERVGLAAEAETSLGKFSRGMLRRFGLAQAWLHSPELILLDEPTAGLDAEGHEVLRGLLREAREAGTTVCLSSHIPGDFGAGCDRLAVMLGGEIIRSGAPDELLGEPGRWSVEVEGLEEARVGELTDWLERAGAARAEVRSTGRELSDLYRPPS